MSDYHDQYVHRFQAFFGAVTIRKINSDGTTSPWLTVDAQAVLPELVVQPHTLRQQIDTIAAAVGWWGRLAAHSKRVVDVLERHKRSWQARFELRVLEQAKAAGEKSPTKALLEASYRTDPEYEQVYSLVEEAEEAHAFCEAMREAFKVKAKVLERDIFRAGDGSLERWSP